MEQKPPNRTRSVFPEVWRAFTCPVAASIWLRQTSAGVFYDVTFSRCWKDEETGKWGYSQSFSDYHLDPLAELAQEAAIWIADIKASAEAVCLGHADEEPFADAIGPD